MIDNPISQIQRTMNSEEAEIPVPLKIFESASGLLKACMSAADLSDVLIGRTKRLQRVLDTLLTALVEEFQLQDNRWAALPKAIKEECRIFVANEFPELFWAAYEETLRANSQAKVKRVASVLANSIFEASSKDASTTAGRMIRHIVELEEIDLGLLQLIDLRQAGARNAGLGVVPRTEAHGRWNVGEIQTKLGLNYGQIHQSCQRLAARGLVRNVGKRNVNDLQDHPDAHSILPEGQELLRFIEQQHS